jgi:hypothetical protein
VWLADALVLGQHCYTITTGNRAALLHACNIYMLVAFVHCMLRLSQTNGWFWAGIQYGVDVFGGCVCGWLMHW